MQRSEALDTACVSFLGCIQTDARKPLILPGQRTRPIKKRTDTIGTGAGIGLYLSAAATSFPCLACREPWERDLLPHRDDKTQTRRPASIAPQY
jgi:hypothetical protein